jgi:Collagen triple helix repeat (20 copies).
MGAKGLDGQDGVGISSMTVTAEGRLLVNLTNGKSLDAGLVRGTDGAPGRDGRDGLPGLPGMTGEKGLDGIHGKDGRDGIDGKDGLGFDDLDADLDVESKTLTHRYLRDGQVLKEKQWFIPLAVHRDVYDASKTYLKGDMVTLNGAHWIALCTTTTRPDTNGGAADWRLCAKRGPEGKIGKTGPQGPPGRDLTQMDSTGRKW